MLLDPVQRFEAGLPHEFDALHLMRLQFVDELLVHSDQLLLGLGVKVQDHVVDLSIDQRVLVDERVVVVLLSLGYALLAFLFLFSRLSGFVLI